MKIRISSYNFQTTISLIYGWKCSSILTLPGSGHQTCVKLTSAECTV